MISREPMGGEMRWVVGSVLVAFAALAAGCTLTQLNSLVPEATIGDFAGHHYSLKLCTAPQFARQSRNPSHAERVAAERATMAMRQGLAVKQKKRIGMIESSANSTELSLPPTFEDDPVVRATIAQAKYSSITSLVQARRLLLNRNSSYDVAALASAPQPQPISTTDFLRFSQKVQQLIVRNGANSAANGNPSQPESKFLQKASAYYNQYLSGHFYTYFSQKFDKPTASLTITDKEIDQAAIVFLEFLLDETLRPTVWVNGTKYYPGNSTNKPTYAVVNNFTLSDKPPLKKINGGYIGCGMNVDKALFLNELAGKFATAAVTETSLSIKTAGGIEVGLGILGKLNIGDNSTLTSLVNQSITDLVERFTVAVGAPILEAIQIDDTKLKQNMQSYGLNMPGRTSHVQAYSALFIGTPAQ